VFSRPLAVVLPWTFVAASLAIRAAAEPRQADRFAKIEEAVLEAKKEFGTPGLSVAVVADDRIVWAKGFGLADVENDVPAKADTVYRIARSKTMSATAVMALREKVHGRSIKIVSFLERPNYHLAPFVDHTSGSATKPGRWR
jgi:CubicO group peptidase (beta-lactamase class C family)